MASTGTITEILDEDGKSYSPKRWRIFVSCGSNPVTGKRRRITRTVHGTKVEARKVLDGIRREVDDGLSVDDERITFGEFAETWLDSRISSGEYSDSYIDRQVIEIKLLDSYIGDVRLRDLDVQSIEALYSRIRRDKTAQRGKYSGRTMNMLHKLLKQVLAKAVDYDLITRNPCDRVKAPKCDEVERRSLTQDEAAKLLRCVDEAESEAYEMLASKERRQTEWGHLFGRSLIQGVNEISYIEAVRIALATGARRGEVLGLLWECVDLDGGRIQIKRSATRHGDLKEPKSRAGIRSISIDSATVAHLRTWKEHQASELRKLGITQGDGTAVCCSAVGAVIDPTNFGRWWQPFREAAGFPDLKFHELRHTQATLLLANGVDIKTVQTRLGHANASITLDCYAHAIPDNDEAAAEMLGDLFGQEPKQAEVVELKTA